MPNGVRARGNSRVANQRRNIATAAMIEATIIENAETVIIEAQDYDTSELDTRIIQLENQIRGMKKQNKLDKKKHKDKFDALETITIEQSKFVKEVIDKGMATEFPDSGIEVNDPAELSGRPITQDEVDYMVFKNNWIESMKARCEGLETTDDDDVKCSICELKLDCKYGHNPQPVFDDPTKRCCKWCNEKVVLDIRRKVNAGGVNWRDSVEPAENTPADQEAILLGIMAGLQRNADGM